MNRSTVVVTMALVLGAGSAWGQAAPPAAAPVPAAKTATATAKANGKLPGKVKGMRTVFVPSPTSPLVALRVFFHVGSADDPAGKEGLAALTSDVMGQGGTKKRTYSEVLDALYPLAARIQVIGDVESIVFEGTVHRDNLGSVRRPAGGADPGAALRR